jgi:hypothetical protein
LSLGYSFFQLVCIRYVQAEAILFPVEATLYYGRAYATCYNVKKADGNFFNCRKFLFPLVENIPSSEEKLFPPHTIDYLMVSVGKNFYSTDGILLSRARNNP